MIKKMINEILKVIWLWFSKMGGTYCAWQFDEVCPYSINRICSFPGDNCYFDNYPMKNNKKKKD